MNVCKLCNQHYNDTHGTCPHCATPAGMVANLDRALVLLEAVRDGTRLQIQADVVRAIDYAGDARWRLLPQTGQYNEVST